MPSVIRQAIWALAVFLATSPAWAGEPPVEYPPDEHKSPLAYVLSDGRVRFVAYTPLELDPRDPAQQARLRTSSIRADLEALRPAFDGLVLYGYHEACTPRIVSVARKVGFQAVIMGVWDPKSTVELDGVVAEAWLHGEDFIPAIVIGNEGLTFDRYELEDLEIAHRRLRSRLPEAVQLTTSEPLAAYERPQVASFGDFLMPNIHPVFDQSVLGPVEAARWVREQAVRLHRQRQTFVFVKETGLPHGGQAEYTPEAQRAFWEAYLEPGIADPLAVAGAGPDATCAYFGCAFEAFDLPWKREASGLEIEAFWGLLSPAREPQPAFDVWRQLGAPH